MPARLARRAIEQAGSREPLVQTMALLHAARVIATADMEEARAIFCRGVALIRTSAPDARTRSKVLREAIHLGATVDTRAAIALFRLLHSAEDNFSLDSIGTFLVSTLAQSGDYASALALLEDLSLEAGGAASVIHSASDPNMRRRALRAAHDRWLARPAPSATSPPSRTDWEFSRVLARHWRLLPNQEAEAWLDELLGAIRNDPEHRGRFAFGHRVEFDRMSDARLFEALSLIRALKPPDFGDAILRAYPRVAQAAETYPHGLESVLQEPPPQAEGMLRGWTFRGSRSARDLAAMPDRITALEGDLGAVDRLLEDARRAYKEDADPDDPNLAPRVFWPSCHAYKAAMYAAGKALRSEAEPLLGRIADADFALLASIELAAGALGLRQHNGVRSEHHPKRYRTAAPGGGRR